MRDDWEIRSPDEKYVNNIISNLGIVRPIAEVLVNRGITDLEDVEYFLYPEKIGFHDPFTMSGMDEVVRILLKIRQNKEKLLIYGDYDADGITATTLMYFALEELGFDVNFYIPNRFDVGYSLSSKVIKEYYQKGYKNIITVDCGITSIEEAKYAKELGVTLIITDHHEPKEVLPDAAAIVDPKKEKEIYPFRHLAGVGVAFKVLQALTKTLNVDINLNDHLDLVAIGTIADIVPIVGENRLMVRMGMEKIQNTNKVGLKSLLNIAGVRSPVNTTDITFRLAPRLNAAGRISDATEAVYLLIEKDEARAYKLAKELNNKNVRRQKLELQIFKEAIKTIESDPKYEEDSILVVAGKDWHIGVIGIVASRVLQRYGKPAIMLSINGDEVRGSARSIEGIDMISILKMCDNMLLKYGGHKMASGLTLKQEQLDRFRAKINSIDLEKEKKIPSLKIDAVLNIDDIKNEFIEQLQLLKPYGNGNEEPVFLIPSVKMFNMQWRGENNLRFLINQSKTSLEGMAYKIMDHTIDRKVFSSNYLIADVVGNIRVKYWNGLLEPKFNLSDLDVSTDLKGIYSYGKDSYTFTDNEIEKFYADLSYELGEQSRYLESKDAILLVDEYEKIIKYMEKFIIMSKNNGKRCVIISPIDRIANLYHNTIVQDLANFDLNVTLYNSTNSAKKSSDVDVLFTSFAMVWNNPNYLVSKDSYYIITDFHYLLFEDKPFDKLSKTILDNIIEKDFKVLMTGYMLNKNIYKKISSVRDFHMILNPSHKKNLFIVDRRKFNKDKEMKDLLSNYKNVFLNFFNLKNYISFIDSEYYSDFQSFSSFVDPKKRKHFERLSKIGKYDKIVNYGVIRNLLPCDKEFNIAIGDLPFNFIEFLMFSMFTSEKCERRIYHLIMSENDINANFSQLFSKYPNYETLINVLRKNKKVFTKSEFEREFSMLDTESFLALLKELNLIEYDGSTIEFISKHVSREAFENTFNFIEGYAEKKTFENTIKIIFKWNTRKILDYLKSPLIQKGISELRKIYS